MPPPIPNRREVERANALAEREEDKVTKLREAQERNPKTWLTSIMTNASGVWTKFKQLLESPYERNVRERLERIPNENRK